MQFAAVWSPVSPLLSRDVALLRQASSSMHDQNLRQGNAFLDGPHPQPKGLLALLLLLVCTLHRNKYTMSFPPHPFPIPRQKNCPGSSRVTDTIYNQIKQIAFLKMSMEVPSHVRQALRSLGNVKERHLKAGQVYNSASGLKTGSILMFLIPQR